MTDIITFPVPKIRMDEPNIITIKIRDFQGALYTTWESRDFINMKVTDGAGSPTTLFRGFISEKRYLHDKTTLTISGFSTKLEQKPINKNYILAQGQIAAVPCTVGYTGVTNIIRPNADDTTNWVLIGGGGSHWDAINDPVTDPTAGQGTHIIAGGDAGGPGCIDIIDMETFSGVTLVTQIVVKAYGKRINNPGNVGVDINLGGWVGALAFGFDDGSYDWKQATFAGLNGSQADLNSLQLKLVGGGAENVDNSNWIDAVYIIVTYNGVNNEALGLETEAEKPAPFNWATDYWITNNNTAIMIVDNSSQNEIKNWECTSIVTNNGTYQSGNLNSLDVKDGNNYCAIETDFGVKMDVTPVIGGAGINKALYIQKITVKWKWYLKQHDRGHAGMNLRIKKEGAYLDIPIDYGPHTAPINTWYLSEGEIVLPEQTSDELKKYLTLDGINYDEMQGLKFQFYGSEDTSIRIDYLVVEVQHISADISPIMEQIDHNTASCVLVDGINWKQEGVTAGGGSVSADVFKIGQNTTQILVDISIALAFDINIQSTLSKYIAQWFRGTYAIEILKKICLLEGLHWWEDHQNYEIVVSKEADFADSTVDLTQANYLWEWEFGDESNQYKAVEVFGAAALRIYYKATDISVTNTSPLIKSIIEETILTTAEAKEVADEQLLEYKVKRPSIRIPLDGVNANLDVGKTVTLTMVRPTVAEDDYPIRMIERQKIGISGIKTMIYCGLGKSTWEENLANIVNKAMYLSHKAHTDRLVSTPLGVGAAITWGDIGGAEAGVEAIITAELINGQSIDNRIDTLIAAEGHPIATGTYTGNTANNRQITGLGFDPTFMILIPYINIGSTWIMEKNTNHATWGITYTHTATGETNTLKFITDGFEVNNNHASDAGNVNSRVYYWVAWG